MNNIKKCQEIQKIMLPKTNIKPADLIIVFGTTYGIDLFCSNIVNLYKDGFAKYILITGDNNTNYNGKNETESVILRELLIKNGIPDDKILIETNSKNTGENLMFSIPILEQQFDDISNIKSIIGVGKIHATRRFLMTMCKYFPEAEKMFFPINVFGCDENFWFLNNDFYEKLVDEYNKIDEYLKNGFICELDDKVLLVK